LTKSDGEVTEIRRVVDIVCQTFEDMENILGTASINGKNELVF
jgi:hypothetical protein